MCMDGETNEIQKYIWKGEINVHMGHVNKNLVEACAGFNAPSKNIQVVSR